MRLPEHVIRRRQGLYLRMRLPPDLARLTGRSHMCRSLGTGDPREARGLAAAGVAGLHGAWQEARARVVATFRGKPFDALGPDDIAALRADLPGALAEIEAMPDSDRVRLHEAIKGIVKRLEGQAFGLRVDREMAQTMMDYGREALLLGKVRGMGEAIALGAQAHRSEPERSAHPEAQAPWGEFIERFYASRPGMSASTRVSYAQAFREWRSLIGDKNLADIRPRDVGRYSEWLSDKANAKGAVGKLNRKTIVRLVGRIRAFTDWAKGAGLLGSDPGAEISVREQTRVERAVGVDGAKRAFTPQELTRIFDSPIYTGCHSRHFRSRPGPNIYRDAAWWIFPAALLTGARHVLLYPAEQ